MSNSTVIRFLKAKDFEQWLSLWDGYNRFYGRSGENALPREVTETTWTRFFDAHEPVHALVAEREGRVLGLVHYLFHRNTAMIEPVCYLQDLFTLEEVRGSGIGKALIYAVYEQAQSAGSTRVYWQTHESNQAAIELYRKVAERSGFIVFRKGL